MSSMSRRRWSKIHVWKAAIIDSRASHPLDGYRRLAFRMLDDVVVIIFLGVGFVLGYIATRSCQQNLQTPPRRTRA